MATKQLKEKTITISVRTSMSNRDLRRYIKSQVEDDGSWAWGHFEVNRVMIDDVATRKRKVS